MVKDSSSNEFDTGWTKEHKDILYMVCKKTGLSDLQAYHNIVKYNGDYNRVINAVKVQKVNKYGNATDNLYTRRSI